MAFPVDRAVLGDLVAQHYDPDGTWGVEQGSRRRMGRVRFCGFDKTTGLPVWKYPGWDHGGVVWLATGKGSNLTVPVWQQAFPALILPASSSLSTTSGPKYDSKVVGPLAVPALKQGLGTWLPDPGLLAQPGALPLGGTLPGGFPVVALGMSTLDEQQLALVPAGHILIAVKNVQLPAFGTPVFDVTANGNIDASRWARDQSNWFVYLVPTTSTTGFFRSAKALIPPGGLAWELGPCVDGSAGHGVVGDLPCIAGTPKPVIPGPAPLMNFLGNPVPGVGQKVIGQFDPTQGGAVGPVGGTGGGAPTLGSTGTQEKPVVNGDVPKTVEKPKGGVPTTQEKVGPGQGLLAVSSYRGRGPLNSGQIQDYHRHAVTPDNKPVNSLHLDEGSLFIGDTGDAPMKFDVQPWQTPRPDGPFTHEVYLRNDAGDEHEWMGKRIPQRRKWQGTDMEDVPSPRYNERPDQPGNPPPPPPPPPPPGWPGWPGWPGGPPGPGGPGGPGGGGPGGNGPKGPKGPGLPGPNPPKPEPPDGGDPPPTTEPPDEGGQGTAVGFVDDQGNVHVGGPNGPVVGHVDPPKPPQPPTPPSPQGGKDDAPPQQKAFPARGPALGVNEIIFRPIAIAEDVGDVRYQMGPMTPKQRVAFDNGPVGVRVNGVGIQSGGMPVIDDPQCGPGKINPGTNPQSGISYGVSDFDVLEHLRDIRQGRTPRIPQNHAVINHEYNVDISFGEINDQGLPANGFRLGRGYDRVSGTYKAMSIEATDSAGNNADLVPAVLLDFIAQKMYLYGVEVATTATAGGSGWVSREASSNFTAPANSSLYVSGSFEIDSGVTYEVPADSILEIG